MKRFIIKTCFFVVPFLVFYGLNVCFYKKDEGDLQRLGFSYYNPSPFTMINKKYNQKLGDFETMERINLDEKKEYDFITIGDSFSDQGTMGYQAYLAKRGYSILHIDRFFSYVNPVENLIALINGGVFDTIKPRYIILENVERTLDGRTDNVDFQAKKGIDSLKVQIVENQKKPIEIPTISSNFFSNTTVKAPFQNLQFLFLDRPLKSDIYSVSSARNNLFTNHHKNILFYKDDIKLGAFKTDKAKIERINATFNKIAALLEKKGIKLIILVAPDKYDLYFPYFKDKGRYVEPQFFQTLSGMKKNYLYIPSYERLSKEIEQGNQDIYYYDDTHWTTKAAGIIADEIHNITLPSK